MAHDEYVNQLAADIAVDVANVLGVPDIAWMRGLVRRIFWAPCHRLGAIGAQFDRDVAEYGFPEGARRVLPNFIAGNQAHGSERIPRGGPVLIASNHPGAADSMVISAHVPRPDYKIIAGNVPFFHNMRSASKHFVRCAPDPHFRVSTFRNAVRHLRSGGALLLFPSSQLDPDPAFMPGAREELDKWSRSLEIMLRLVPDTQVVVTVVSGVLRPASQRSPLTWVRRGRIARQTSGELTQLIPQMLFGWQYSLYPTVTFAEPLSMTDLSPSSKAGEATAAIIQRAREHMAEHLALTA